MKNLIFCLMLLLCGLSPAVWASCSFTSGTGGISVIYMDNTLVVPVDSAPGTVLWSSGWRSSGSAEFVCDSGVVGGNLPSGIGAAVPGYTNSQGFPSVFKTNIEGIGVSVYWCNDSCPDLNSITPLPSMGGPAAGTYKFTPSWLVNLIKTGPISTAGGEIDISGLSNIYYDNLKVAEMLLSGSTAVVGRSCDVNPDSHNITVVLPTIYRNDLHGGTDAGGLIDNSKARPFRINLQCDAGVAINYQIDGPSSGNDVLDNARGEGLASGIGIQLFRGEVDSGLVQPLARKLPYAMTSSNNQPVSIPLAAKYYKTGSVVTGGQVAVTATFTLTYE